MSVIWSVVNGQLVDWPIPSENVPGHMDGGRFMPNREPIGSKMSTAVELDWFGPRSGNTSFLAICTQALWSKRVNGQLPPRSPKLKSSAIIWMDGSQPKFEVPDVKDGRAKLGPPIRSHHYLRE